MRRSVKAAPDDDPHGNRKIAAERLGRSPSMASMSACSQPLRRLSPVAGKSVTTLALAMSVWSDPVTLPVVHDPATAELLGRKLAVSFHLVGESGRISR